VEVAGSNPSLFAAQLFALHLRSRTLLRARWKRLVCGHAGQRGGEAEKTRCHLGLSFWSSCGAIGLSGEPGAGGEEDTSSLYLTCEFRGEVQRASASLSSSSDSATFSDGEAVLCRCIKRLWCKNYKATRAAHDAHVQAPQWHRTLLTIVRAVARSTAHPPLI
jgi:hypothetical protein